MEVSPHAVSGVEYQGSPLPRRIQAALCDPDEMRTKEWSQWHVPWRLVRNIVTKPLFPKEGALRLKLVIKESIEKRNWSQQMMFWSLIYTDYVQKKKDF